MNMQQKFLNDKHFFCLNNVIFFSHMPGNTDNGQNNFKDVLSAQLNIVARPVPYICVLAFLCVHVHTHLFTHLCAVMWRSESGVFLHLFCLSLCSIGVKSHHDQASL